MKKLAFVALALLPLTNVASAEGRSFDEYLIQENVTLLNVKSQVSIKTQPDMFKTVIQYEETDRNSAEAQADLNEEIAQATQMIKAAGLEYKLQNFNTYKNNKSNKFTARQAIVLETADRTRLEALVTALQAEDGRVVHTSSTVTTEGEKKFFEELFAKAKQEATAKADFIAKQMNADKYTVTRIDYYINENHRPMMMRAMAAEAAPNAKMEMDNSKKEISMDLTMSIAVMNKDK